MKLFELSRLLPYHSCDTLPLHLGTLNYLKAISFSSAQFLQGKIWVQFFTSEQSTCIEEVLIQLPVTKYQRLHREVHLAQILVAGESISFHNHVISVWFCRKTWDICLFSDYEKTKKWNSVFHPPSSSYNWVCTLSFGSFLRPHLPLRIQEWDRKSNLFPLGTLVNCKRI